MAVKIYSTSTCIFCKKAKEFLSENQIVYDEIDVSINKEAARELIAISGQIAVPVLDINGNIILGFDKDKIKSALGLTS